MRPMRSFSTTRPSRSILDYFKARDKKTAAPKTEQVMGKATEGDIKVDTAKIPILGRKNPADGEWKNKMNGFNSTSWIPTDSVFKRTLSDKSKYASVVDEMLTSMYNQVYGASITSNDFASTKLNNLELRFKLIKKAQKEFGVHISDITMTRSQDLAQLQEFLHSQLDPNKLPFNEKVPQAIHLNASDYKNSNVYINSSVSEKVKTQKFKQLLQKATKLQQEENRRALESV